MQTLKKTAAPVALLLALCLLAGCARQAAQAQTASTFAMDTMVTQTAYGPRAGEAMQAVNRALAAYEARLSLYGQEEGDIARINAAAGQGAVEVAPETAQLLRASLGLSAQSEGAFAITIAPVTLAWDVTGEGRVVPLAERDALLPLVDDGAVELEGDTVRLPQAGMGIDLGGIAKGAACSLAGELYAQHEVESALLYIGGNIYARGEKPGGQPWKVGFRDPEKGGEHYIASLPLKDAVIAVSGGDERFFEADGKTYIHIFDPRTAAPAQSDIVSVGVVHPDGMTADFWSTTLYVWGKERALAHMRAGGQAVLLDGENNLYVSAGLSAGFELYEGNDKTYKVHIVEESGDAQ